MGQSSGCPTNMHALGWKLTGKASFIELWTESGSPPQAGVAESFRSQASDRTPVLLDLCTKSWRLGHEEIRIPLRGHLGQPRRKDAMSTDILECGYTSGTRAHTHTLTYTHKKPHPKAQGAQALAGDVDRGSIATSSCYWGEGGW